MATRSSNRTKPKTGTNPTGKAARDRKAAEAANRAAKNSPQAQDDRAVADLVGEDARGASILANKFFADSSLGRVNETRSDEATGILDRLAGIRDVYGIPGRNRSAEVSQNLASLKSQAEGYTSGEYQGFREQQKRGTESAYKTQDAATQRSIARNRLTGSQAALMKNVNERNRAQATGQLEQDLMLKSADEKYKRTGEYGETVRGVEGTEFDRMRSTGSDYADRLDLTRNDELKRTLLNQNNVAQERAGQSGTYFGALNLGESRRTGNRNYKLARQAYGLSKPKKSTGRGSSSSSNAGANPAFDYNGYLDAQKEILTGGG